MPTRWERPPSTESGPRLHRPRISPTSQNGGLPSSDHDLYLEVTTLRQSLVTRKNRKVRLLRQTHPDVRVRILYRRDLDRLRITHAA